MALTVRCPSAACGRESSVPEEHAGRALRCPHCGQRFAVGSSGGGAAAAGISPAAPTPAPASGAPARVGRFLVSARLGAGAFGAVYRARDPQLDREVALKVPHPATLEDPGRLGRFLREAKAAARLRHPHIVPVYDAGGNGPDCYIASAYIAGRTLARALADGGPFEAARAARAARQLAGALGYAHSQGVVHRDVKPANVLLDERDDAHLTDFGLAQLRDADGLTRDGALLGTPAYMAPELVRGEGASPAADQYALGVLLYELLCGRPPFEGPPEAVLHQAAHAAPPPPGGLRPGLPRDLETVCLKAMARRPQDRYATCQDLADDLRRFLDGEPVRARRLSPAGRLARWARRQPLLAGLAAASAGATLLFIGTLLAANRQITQEKRRAEDALADLRAEQFRTEEALRERTAALEERTRAVAEEWRASYFRRVALAHREWHASNVAGVRRYLAECVPDPARPDPSRPDLRSWEWHYLNRLCRADLFTVPTEAPAGGVACSPDGKHLALASGEVIRILDPDTGREQRAFRGHVGAVGDLAYSPDGRRLVSVTNTRLFSGPPHEVKVWDPEAGRNLFTVRGTRCAAFSPDGKRLVAADGKDLTVWDAAGGTELLRLTGHNSFVNCVAYSPDGKWIASGALYEVKLWDAATGKQVHNIRGFGDFVKGVAFGPDGRRLAASSWRQVRVLDVVTAEELLYLPGHGNFANGVAFSPDGARLAAAGSDGTVRLWDARRGSELINFRGHGGGALGVAFHPDGRRLASVGDTPTGGDLKVWDTFDVPECRALRGHGSWVRGLAFSRDGRRLASSADAEGSIKVWDVASRKEVRNFSPRGSPAGRLRGPGALSPDGRRLAAVGPGGSLNLWDVESGEERVSPQGRSLGSHVAFSPDGRWLAVGAGGESKAGVLPEAAGGTEVLLLPGLDFPVFSPDGRRLAGLEKNRITIRDAATREEVVNLAEGARAPFCFSPDGRRLAALWGKGAAAIYDAETGRELVRLESGEREVNAVAFTADGRRLATASTDMTIKLWDSETGQDVLTLRDRLGWVFAVAFSPDGRFLASTGLGGTVLLWDGTPRE